MTTNLIDRPKELLANHPRLVAGLCTLLLLLSQAGMVLAESGKGGGYGGP